MDNPDELANHWWPWEVSEDGFEGVRPWATVSDLAWDSLLAEALRCLACRWPLLASRRLPEHVKRVVPEGVLLLLQTLLRHEEAARCGVPAVAVVPLLTEAVGRCLEWLPSEGSSDLAVLALHEIKKIGDDVMQKYVSWKDSSKKSRGELLQQCFGVGKPSMGTVLLDFSARSLRQTEDNGVLDAMMETALETFPLEYRECLREPLRNEHVRVHQWLHRFDDYPGLRFPQPSLLELLFSLAFYHAQRLQGILCRFCGFRQAVGNSGLCGICGDRGLAKFVELTNDTSVVHQAGLSSVVMTAITAQMSRNAVSEAINNYENRVKDMARAGSTKVIL